MSKAPDFAPLPSQPETELYHETPGIFRIGEVFSPSENIDGAGNLLPGSPLLVVLALYRGDGDYADQGCTSAVTYDDIGNITHFESMGGTERTRFSVSLGKRLSPLHLLRLSLAFTQAPDPTIDPRTVDLQDRHNRFTIVNTVEQVIADKVAHSEEVSPAEKEIDQARRLRDANYDTRLSLRGPAPDLDLTPYLDITDSWAV